MLLLPHAGGLSRLLTILYMSITGMLRKNNVKLYKYGIDWGMALASLFIPSFWWVARRGIVRGSEESIAYGLFYGDLGSSCHIEVGTSCIPFIVLEKKAL